ncbi:putative phosphoglycerate mutase [Saccharopolyspora erythraea NRRL 2338]|uniref:Phosphoglycerate mutase n=2 Tax=Saccharopolyspora erythraea TaxID=1836 RepID=A4FKS4_SACEN|nr:histidine phosphatase family protein [Saccharopolyspora erythraea]EQD83711.1 phosphoglycerate mutase [Saccharopolyspora erythraea D]PFG98288.1 putative phosphoglycerate mutase [Saccharopolyspora erythraea NRRL 2338]QRK88374.1 histidine phosphatase family protein [Saccharopolyspora erythraea]CAM04649.1 phosphoglycerate mutase [Saccharopolyspora erythraea NRRL 2338]
MASRTLYLARHGDAPAGDSLSEAGRAQAALLGERLRDVPLSAIHHSPWPRAVETAKLVAEKVPNVAVTVSEALGDHVPPVTDGVELPAAYREFINAQPAVELERGASLAEAAIRLFTGEAESDSHELLVTHAFVIGWFVRHALDAPDWRWMGLNAANCSLTIIRYHPGRPPSLLCFNDLSHLPETLRWTGFPAELRP